MFSLDLLNPDVKPAQLAAQLYLIAKETSPGKDIERYWRQRQATSRFVVAQVLLHDDLLSALRRQIRRLSPDVKVSRDELAALLCGEVLKRDVLEGDKADAAASLVKKLARRRARKQAAKTGEHPVASPAAASL